MTIRTTIIIYNQQARRSVGNGLFYLNQDPRFEAWEYSCVKYLLGEVYCLSGHTRLESRLVKTQYNFQIPDDLIYQKIYIYNANL